jgi:hypothetical protein
VISVGFKPINHTLGTISEFAYSPRANVLDYDYYADKGGISQLHELELLNSLVLKASQVFDRRRNLQVQYLIRSSEYLTALERRDSRKAYYKALQAIRRDPQRDKPGLLDDSEKAALAVIRKNLNAPYWRLYRQDWLESIISRRLRYNDLQFLSQSLRVNLARQLVAGQPPQNARIIRKFRKRIARLPHRTAEQAAAVLMLLLRYGQTRETQDAAVLCDTVAHSYESQLPLTLVYFACLDAAANKALSVNPAEYMPAGFNSRRLHRQSALLMKLLSDLEVLRAPYELKVFLADTDAITYVFPCMSQQFTESEYWNRVESHCTDLLRQQDWMSNYRCNVERWSIFEMRNVAKFRRFRKDELWSTIARALDPGDIDGEADALAEEFRPSDCEADRVYPPPDFKRMARLKILMYAVQGYQLESLTPAAAPILLQAESPDPRRVRMYRALLHDETPGLSIISPWARAGDF